MVALVDIIPTIGFFLVVSGFGFSIKSTIGSNILNVKSKMKGFANIMLKSGSQIVSGTAAAIIGQSVIPIPFLGAFIGGLIGGIIGGGIKMAT